MAHGLGASLAQTRPLLSAVPGTKVFAQLRGHGAAWTGTPGYQALADDLLALADRHGATQALGVSLGAGALLRLLSLHPDRFARVVLYLPAALDHPNPEAVRRGAALAQALRAADEAAVQAWVRAELPAGLPEASARAQLASRTAALRDADLLPLLEALTTDVPVADRRVLARVTAQVLVLGEEGDPVHPAALARELAAVLGARLEVFARPGALVHERDRLRSLIADWLGQAGQPTGAAGG